MATCTLDDIENIGADEDEIVVRAPRPVTIAPKVKLVKRGPRDSGNVPGTQTIYMKTFGCAHNVSDGEYMQGTLAAYGYAFTTEPENADLWFLNSCTVKNPSETAFMNLVKRAKERKKGIVVAGCVPQGDRNINGLEGVSIVGVSQIDRVVEVVEETLKGNTVRLLSKKTLPSLDLPKIRKNPLVEIVPISTGCLGACTYCKTKHARGKLGSYSLDALTRRVRDVVSENVAEIWLSSEDTGAWGIDLGLALPDLLDAIVSILPTDQSVMLRVGMTNPPYMLEHLEAIARTLRHPSVFSFLHVPLQSGSDAVLKNMNREYTSGDFRKVADYLLEHVPGMTLATDIICGFPYETEDDHRDTLELLKHYKLPVVNISQFYPRPGTEAKKMKQLNTKIKKTRSREVTEVFHSYEPYHTMMPVGTKCTAWVANELSSDGSQSVAHTKSYVKVLIPKDESLRGAKIEVEVTAVAKFHVVANVLKVHFKHSSLGNFESNPQQDEGRAVRVNGDAASDCGGHSGSCGLGDACCSVEKNTAGKEGEIGTSGCCESNGVCGTDGSGACCGGKGAAAQIEPMKNAMEVSSKSFFETYLMPVVLSLVLMQVVMMVRNNFVDQQ